MKYGMVVVSALMAECLLCFCMLFWSDKGNASHLRNFWCLPGAIFVVKTQTSKLKSHSVVHSQLDGSHREHDEYQRQQLTIAQCESLADVRTLYILIVMTTAKWAHTLFGWVFFCFVLIMNGKKIIFISSTFSISHLPSGEWRMAVTSAGHTAIHVDGVLLCNSMQ